MFVWAGPLRSYATGSRSASRHFLVRRLYTALVSTQFAATTTSQMLPVRISKLL